MTVVATSTGRSRASHRSKPWRKTAAKHPEPLADRRAKSAGCSTITAIPRAGEIACRSARPAAPTASGTVSDLQRRRSQALRVVGIRARERQHAGPAGPPGRTGPLLCASHPSKSAVAPSRASKAGITAASTIRLTAHRLRPSARRRSRRCRRSAGRPARPTVSASSRGRTQRLETAYARRSDTGSPATCAPADAASRPSSR